jgi:GDP-4-dehydro-6-deoxy-D-mannose reductase
MSKRALVTGSEGFVGRVLSGRLESAGYEVLGCDSRLERPAADRRLCDIASQDSVNDLYAWAGTVDVVFHLAAVTFVPDAGRDPSGVMNVNLGGTIHLLAGLPKDSRFVFVGSAEAYGPPLDLPITETHPLNPANPYAISKAACDQYCAYAHRQDGLDIVVARPFNHSGPGQSDRFVLSSFARQITRIAAGRQAPVLHVGNIDVSRDFSHVGDVVRAYEVLAEQGVAGEAYNVCSGHAQTLRDVLAILADLASVEIDVRVDPERVRKVDVPKVVGSHAKLTEQTGWRPEISFEQLLQDLLGYWQARSD